MSGGTLAKGMTVLLVLFTGVLREGVSTWFPFRKLVRGNGEFVGALLAHKRRRIGQIRMLHSTVFPIIPILEQGTARMTPFSAQALATASIPIRLSVSPFLSKHLREYIGTQKRER